MSDNEAFKFYKCKRCGVTLSSIEIVDKAYIEFPLHECDRNENYIEYGLLEHIGYDEKKGEDE